GRKTVESSLQAAQLVARDRTAFRTRRIDCGAERIEIGNSLDGDDLLASHAPDQKMASSSKDKSFSGFRQLLVGRLIDLDVDVLPEICDVALVAPVMLQVLHQSRLQGQHFALEPGIDFGRSYHRALLARADLVKAGIRVLGHPPTTACLQRIV